MPELERIEADAGADPICAALVRDGACVVKNALSPDSLAGLNRDLEAQVAAATPPNESVLHRDMVRFYGGRTIRIDGIPGKSETFVEFMLDPLMHEVCRQVLLPSCTDYILNVAQLIQIGPGEDAQRLHRDEEAWPDMPKNSPDLEVEAMMALTDFTVENGATRVVLGSHLWDAERVPDPGEVIHAEMEAGSALYYLGKTVHGGGANTRTDQSRRGMFYGYVLELAQNWRKHVPHGAHREGSADAGASAGAAWLQVAGGIGLANVSSPMALLR